MTDFFWRCSFVSPHTLCGLIYGLIHDILNDNRPSRFKKQLIEIGKNEIKQV